MKDNLSNPESRNADRTTKNNKKHAQRKKELAKNGEHEIREIPAFYSGATQKGQKPNMKASAHNRGG